MVFVRLLSQGQHELPLEALAEVVHCYPTQAEVLKRIANNYLKAAKAAKV